MVNRFGHGKGLMAGQAEGLKMVTENFFKKSSKNLF
jgi:hypothetical protein